MSRTCTICAHPDRELIDSEVVSNETYRAVAAKYGVNKSAVQRHAESHLPEALTQAADRAKEESGDDLLAKVRRLEGRLSRWLDKAEASNDQRAMVGLAKECRGTLELLLRATGQLQTGPLVNVNMPGMGSPTGAGSTPQSFEYLDAATIADALLGELPPAKLADVARLLLEATSLEATGHELPALAPVNLSAETQPTPHLHSSEDKFPGVVQPSPVMSRFQPGRPAGT
jgi:hypothetical protein